MRPATLAGCFALLLSCTSGETSRRHAPSAVGLQAAHFLPAAPGDSLHLAGYRPAPAGADLDGHALALRFEQFLDAATSLTLLLERRHWTADPRAGGRAMVALADVGLRFYPRFEEELQPFFSFGVRRAGLDVDGDRGTQDGIGGALGAGVAWFPNRSTSLEFGARLEALQFDPLPGGGIPTTREDWTTSVSLWLGVAYFFD